MTTLPAPPQKPVTIPSDQGEGNRAKDQRVFVLAGQIATLMRAHSRRHEAFDALDVARILFRPSYTPTVEDQASASQSHAEDSVSPEAIQ
jgi:hypothetical protein